jgi:hypothetical protein
MKPVPWQTLPAQQACPGAPHISQVLGALPGGLLQPRPPLQVLPVQQATPALPHAVQTLLAQRAPLAVQNWPPPPPPAVPQHAPPIAPQGVPAGLLQVPLLQVPLTPVPVQACPEPVQIRTAPPPASLGCGIQQPPPLQTLPPQQGCPGRPQSAVPELPPVEVALVVPPVPPVALPPPPHPLMRIIRADAIPTAQIWFARPRRSRSVLESASTILLVMVNVALCEVVGGKSLIQNVFITRSSLFKRALPDSCSKAVPLPMSIYDFRPETVGLNPRTCVVNPSPGTGLTRALKKESGRRCGDSG